MISPSLPRASTCPNRTRNCGRSRWIKSGRIRRISTRPCRRMRRRPCGSPFRPTACWSPCWWWRTAVHTGLSPATTGSGPCRTSGENPWAWSTRQPCAGCYRIWTPTTRSPLSLRPTASGRRHRQCCSRRRRPSRRSTSGGSRPEKISQAVSGIGWRRPCR